MSKEIDRRYCATVVSIVPFPIKELKPGIYPGEFMIPASKNEMPEFLVVGESTYYVEVDEARSITVKCPPNEIARSIVEDYISSNLAYSVDSAPGIMWIPGFVDYPTFLMHFAEDNKKLQAQQTSWFKKLVQLADDDWEKTHQHKTISDMQRHACRAMALNRDWVVETNDIGMLQKTTDYIKCFACQSPVSTEAIVCPSCKLILNAEKYKSLKFANVD